MLNLHLRPYGLINFTGYACIQSSKKHNGKASIRESKQSDRALAGHFIKALRCKADELFEADYSESQETFSAGAKFG